MLINFAVVFIKKERYTHFLKFPKMGGPLTNYWLVTGSTVENALPFMTVFKLEREHALDAFD